MVAIDTPMALAMDMPATTMAEVTTGAPLMMAAGVEMTKSSKARPPSGPPRPSSAVTVDASALVAFDSSALAVLLGLRRVVLAQGGALHITGMTARLRELASLYGVLDLLPQV